MKIEFELKRRKVMMAQLVLHKTYWIIAAFTLMYCSSARQVQEAAPMTISDAYYQAWVSGIEGGGYGVNIFITVEPSAYVLDSVYFRGSMQPLERLKNDPNRYAGYFVTDQGSKDRFVLSGDSIEEFKNESPLNTPEPRFSIRYNECVVRYSGKTTGYFIIRNIREQPSIPYPSAPKDHP